MEIILELAKNDIRKRVAGSYLGNVWIVVQPIITILIMWLVFSLGFRTPTVEGVPFVIWIASGMVVWSFFSEATIQVMNSLIEYNFMLKQMSFKAIDIPKIKILSSSMVHAILNVLLLMIYFIYGGKIDFYLLQILYYYLCLILLIYSVGLLTSSLRVFVKDIGEITTTILQLGFWYTPIFWNLNIVPDKYKWLFKLNPVSYIVEGYRDCYIFKIPFYSKTKETLVFFIATIGMYLLGYFVFNRLKKQFNDML